MCNMLTFVFFVTVGLDSVSAPSVASARLRYLNLGSGSDYRVGFTNVELRARARHASTTPPDLVHDLTVFPWPFATSSADEVVMQHVLEHLPDFASTVQELYRITAADGRVEITVPWPRHSLFLGDYTHVTAVTPQLLSSLSVLQCEEWERKGLSNTLTALDLGVDFRIEWALVYVDVTTLDFLADAGLIDEDLVAAVDEDGSVITGDAMNSFVSLGNIFGELITQFKMSLRVIKNEPAGECATATNQEQDTGSKEQNRR